MDYQIQIVTITLFITFHSILILRANVDYYFQIRIKFFSVYIETNQNNFYKHDLSF